MLAAAHADLPQPRQHEQRDRFAAVDPGDRAGIEMAVLEMGGAYALGEVALLAEIARPTVGVVTNVYPGPPRADGHDRGDRRDQRPNWSKSLPASGRFAVLNGDDSRVRAMAARTAARRSSPTELATTATFTRRQIANVGHRRHSIPLRTGSTEYAVVRLPLVGAHAVELALAAIATGHAFGSADRRDARRLRTIRRCRSDWCSLEARTARG